MRADGSIRLRVASPQYAMTANNNCNSENSRSTPTSVDGAALNAMARSAEKGGGGSRACCFCWCCCCSCSCLSVQNNEANNRGQNTGIELIDDNSSSKPTYEDVKAWGTSFDRLMKHRVGQKLLADFLKSEFSDENILFWQACEELKKERNPEKIEEKARIIYEDFISILSPKEVSLDSRVREIINNNMVHPTAHTFDEAQSQIYTLMHRDSYPRFVGSGHYRKLLASYGECEEL